MTLSLSASWKTIAIGETVLVAILAVALFRSPTPKDQTVTTRDSVRTIHRDTTREKIDLGFLETTPEPTDTLREERKQKPDTSEGRSSAVGRKIPPILTYSRQIDHPLVSGSLTSVVEGRLLRQKANLSVTRPVIKTRVRDRISTKTLKVRQHRLQVLGAGGFRFEGLSPDVTIGGGIRLPGTGSLIYQHGPFSGSHQVTVTIPILSL